MEYTLTVVASRSKQVPEDQLDDAGPDKDDSIQAVLNALKLRDSATHEVRRASSVAALRRQLREYRPEGRTPHIVQIVGHGIPGIVFLGASWKGVPYGPDDYTRVHALDSNIWYYDMLRDAWEIGNAQGTELPVYQPPKRVLLLGCAVGDEGLVNSVDGPTLLFDLSHLWQCPVSGPTSEVYSTDFKVEGRNGVYPYDDKAYQAKMNTVAGDRLVKGSGTAVSVPGNTPMTFVRLLAAPAFGPRASMRPDLGSGHGHALALALGQLVGPPIANNPQLAAPMFEFEIRTADGERWVGTVLDNVRCLRLVHQAGTKPMQVYAISEDRRRTFAAHLRAIVTLGDESLNA